MDGQTPDVGYPMRLLPWIAAACRLTVAFAWGGPTALVVATLLSVMEVSLSFDNAVVNAAVLRRMDPVWQRRFLTWGILFAVFGMRLIFPDRGEMGRHVEWASHMLRGKAVSAIGFSYGAQAAQTWCVVVIRSLDIGQITQSRCLANFVSGRFRSGFFLQHRLPPYTLLRTQTSRVRKAIQTATANEAVMIELTGETFHNVSKTMRTRL